MKKSGFWGARLHPKIRVRTTEIPKEPIFSMTPRILGDFDNFLGDLPGTARQGRCGFLAVQVRKS